MSAQIAEQQSLTLQLRPLQLNPDSNEPFLRLPDPHDYIILTPPRMHDAQDIVNSLNDDRVYPWLASVPHPYHLEDAVASLDRMMGTTTPILNELYSAAAAGVSSPAIVSGCPVNTIRELRPGGSDAFIGSCLLVRSRFQEILDPDERRRVTEDNNARSPGDPDIIWSFGYFMAPSHQGKGVMSAAVSAIIHEWAVPRMGVRRIRAGAFTGNYGSIKVFEKNGFRMMGTIEECIEVTARRRAGGPKRSLHLLEWTTT